MDSLNELPDHILMDCRIGVGRIVGITLGDEEFRSLRFLNINQPVHYGYSPWFLKLNNIADLYLIGWHFGGDNNITNIYYWVHTTVG